MNSELPFHTEWYGNGYSEVALAFHIDDRDINGAYRVTIDYQTDVFRDEKEVELLYKRIMHILSQMISDADRTIEDISIIPDDEYHSLLIDFNDTKVDYCKDKCVHELFVEQSERTPEKIALVFKDKEFTYKQIDEMSNSLAHILREKGIGRGDVVPIIAVRSWHIIVAMMGILKAGAAYMPVSPEYPKDRVDYILNEAACKVACVFGYDEMLENVEEINLDRVDYGCDVTCVENVNTIEDLCYIVFTSGSTGTPKGVVIKHENVINYSHNNNNVCHSIIKSEYKKIISVTNIVFDIFVTESILPLLNGMTVFFTSDNEINSQKK